MMSRFLSNDRGNNRYGELDEARARKLLDLYQRSTLQSAVTVIFIGFCIAFLILSAWNFSKITNQTVSTRVLYLNSMESLLHTVSDKFLSFGLDTSLLRNMTTLPIQNNKFMNLARNLAPAYLRVGGTSADCLYFNQTAQTVSKKIFSSVDGQDISNFTINNADFENLYNFSKVSNLCMIFDINALIRTIDGAWNILNAKDIISFAKSKNMSLDWQLGNEPNSFRHVFNITVNATQLAKDYYELRQLLNEIGYEGSLLVGPEVNHVGDTSHKGEQYAQTFLQNDKHSVNYVTWHQYYLDGREAQVTDFINVSTFNYLPMEIESMNEAIKHSQNIIPMWLSETSTAYGGGAPGLSDRFVAGFLWLDKLGYSASAGVNVVIRQSLFGGNYAMIGPDLEPNPDWWVSVIYKQFVSEKVLELLENNFEYVRLYAHCTAKKALINGVAAVTIYGVNIDKAVVHIDIRGIPVFRENAKVFLYTLTSDSLQSRSIRMNGEPLELEENGNLPSFRPMILAPTQVITLPPYSMVFIVVHGAKVPACTV